MRAHHAAFADDAEKLAALRADAESGDAQAQRLLALRYLRGRGITQNPALAFLWMERAAAQGFARAVRDLGDFHARGIGVSADQETAMRCYRAAALAGDPIARARLRETG